MNGFFMDQNQVKQIAYKVCIIYKHQSTNKSKLFIWDLPKLLANFYQQIKTLPIAPSSHALSCSFPSRFDRYKSTKKFLTK
jgi:hypothetical protein